MKKLHAAGAVLLLGCIVLGIISVVLYMGQDHTAPEITIEEADITYTEGEAYTALMEGVTAKDDQDGDLTDQVFVDKVIPTGEDTAMVYYGAIDSAKNVATKGRKIHYIPAAEDAAAEETDVTDQQRGRAGQPDPGTDAKRRKTCTGSEHDSGYRGGGDWF